MCTSENLDVINCLPHHGHLYPFHATDKMTNYKPECRSLLFRRNRSIWEPWFAADKSLPLPPGSVSVHDVWANCFSWLNKKHEWYLPRWKTCQAQNTCIVFTLWSLDQDPGLTALVWKYFVCLCMCLNLSLLLLLIHDIRSVTSQKLTGSVATELGVWSVSVCDITKGWFSRTAFFVRKLLQYHSKVF